MCLEAILGIISACLPVLKPVFDKLGDWFKTFSRMGNTSSSLNYGTIPIWIQVSRMWQSRSERRVGNEELDSIFEMDDWRRTQNCIEPAPGGVQNVGMNKTEIRVQRDVHVESV